MGAWIFFEGVSVSRLKKFVDRKIVKQLYDRHFALPPHPDDVELATNRFLRGLLDNLVNEEEWMRPYIEAVNDLPGFQVLRSWGYARKKKVFICLDCHSEAEGLMTALFKSAGKNKFKLVHYVTLKTHEGKKPEDFGLPLEIIVEER